MVIVLAAQLRKQFPVVDINEPAEKIRLCVIFTHNSNTYLDEPYYPEEWL